MDVYSRLMDIDEVTDYLNEKTTRVFNRDKTLKFINEKKIPIVFEYKGSARWEFIHEGKWQSLNIQVNGYFKFQNDSNAVKIFKDFLEKIDLEDALIYQLVSHRFARHVPVPDGIKPKEGDTIFFGTSDSVPNFNLPCQAPIKIGNDKVGVLKKDLKDYLNKVEFEQMDDKTKIEALKSKIEKLETENARLIQQLTQTKAELVDRPAEDKELNAKDSAYCLIAILKDLLLDPDINAYHFKTESKTSNSKPTQTGLANHIDDLQIPGIKKDNINILLQDANKKLKDAKSKVRDKPTKL